MSHYIGSDLSDKEVAALQAVADASVGVQYALVSRLPEALRSLRRPAGLEDPAPGELEALLARLGGAGLVELVDHPRHGRLVGLTADGRRCNRVDVVDPF